MPYYLQTRMWNQVQWCLPQRTKESSSRKERTSMQNYIQTRMQTKLQLWSRMRKYSREKVWICHKDRIQNNLREGMRKGSQERMQKCTRGKVQLRRCSSLQASSRREVRRKNYTKGNQTSSHQMPRCKWKEMPRRSKNSMQKYAKKDLPQSSNSCSKILNRPRMSTRSQIPIWRTNHQEQKGLQREERTEMSRS